MHYLWRAVDHEGEVLEAFATKQRDRKAALRFMKRAMKRYGQPKVIVTDRLKSYRAAMNVIGNTAAQTCGQWLNNRAEKTLDHVATQFGGDVGSYSNWRWHLDEVFVRINGEMHYLWRAVDHEGEVLEAFAETSRPCRSLLPPTPLSTIISIRNVIFITARTSNSIAPLLWPSGVNLQLERPQLQALHAQPS